MEATSISDQAHYDIAVLGGGSGGYVAAIRAAQLGFKVALIEESKVGGTCLHKGCIASKAYLRTAELMHWSRQSHQFGIEITEPILHWNKVAERKQLIVETLYQGVQGLIRKNKINLIEGRGKLIAVPDPINQTGSAFPRTPAHPAESSKHSHETGFTFAIGGLQIRARSAIIATGSRPITMGLPLDSKQIMTSDQALERLSLPQSVIIIGGGTIGMEWASLYNDCGVKVTVVESLIQILPSEDQDIAKEMIRLMNKRGVRFLTNTRVNTDQIIKQANSVQVPVNLPDGTIETLEAEAVLLSIGRHPNTEAVISPDIPLAMKERYIAVNEFQETNVSGLYAVGDVCGGGLAHVASLQGTIAVERIANHSVTAFKPQSVPKCTYTRPEIASIGYSETEALEQGFLIKTGRFPFRAVGKALVQGEFEGFAKIITDVETNSIIGVHVIGAQATELISESSLVLANSLELSQWMSTIHPHPSLSEVFHESLLSVEQRAIHL